MAPPPPVRQTATLHAITERLADTSRMGPLFGMPSGFPSALSSQAMAAAAVAYRQPAPPPQLPACPFYSRHQDHGLQDAREPDGVVLGDGQLRCPRQRQWREPTEHGKARSTALSDEQLGGFVRDMATVVRREFDCWVEQCWTEAFHYLFTQTLPTLIIHLILTGSSPSTLRRQIVHAGPALDAHLQMEMVARLHSELELRLSGSPDRPAVASVPLSPAAHKSAQLSTGSPVPHFDYGVCFQNLMYTHDPGMDEDDHGICLCHLTTCLDCFSSSAKARKGAYSLLPYDLASSSVAKGWSGAIESEAQWSARKSSLEPHRPKTTRIPDGKGFVKNPKSSQATDTAARPPPLFPHPQMTDVLAVEEHLRWRLKEMGASDPAVEARYGPCTHSPAALDGIDLPLQPADTESEQGSDATSAVKGMKGKGGAKKINAKRKMLNAANGLTMPKKDSTKEKTNKQASLLPKEWLDADPQERNMAIILTFRHFVKLLHRSATAASPFSYPGYEADVRQLTLVHPIAMYRRLAGLAQEYQGAVIDIRDWNDCMDKWGEELGAKEKAAGNKLVSTNPAAAVLMYSRAISLDPKKTVYFTNRAVALNALGRHSEAETDCKHILAKDGKNSKAYYQRAVARKGMLKWREAEADLKMVLKFESGSESAKNLMAIVKAQVAKLPKQTAQDAMDF